MLHVGPNGFSNDPNSHNSFLYYISYGLSYINYSFLGVCGADNWQYSACLLTALPAKEVVLGTIKNMYSQHNEPIAALFHLINDDNNAIVYLRVISFLTFFMFYVPCIPTIVTMRSSVS